MLSTTTNTTGELILLGVSDRHRAQAFLARMGALPVGSYAGVRMLRYPAGTELAFVGRFLVLGQDAVLRAAIDVAAGRTPSLAADPGYQRAAVGEPADRVLDADVSAAGIRRLLSARGGPLGSLGVLLSGPALTGTTISVSPAAGGARVRIHSAGPAAGVAGQVGPLLRRLGAALSAEGVQLGSVTSLFGGETAVAITPRAHPGRGP
jgi:hypothetical protein